MKKSEYVNICIFDLYTLDVINIHYFYWNLFSVGGICSSAKATIFFMPEIMLFWVFVNVHI